MTNAAIQATTPLPSRLFARLGRVLLAAVPTRVVSRVAVFLADRTDPATGAAALVSDGSEYVCG